VVMGWIVWWVEFYCVLPSAALCHSERSEESQCLAREVVRRR